LPTALANGDPHLARSGSPRARDSAGEFGPAGVRAKAISPPVTCTPAADVTSWSRRSRAYIAMKQRSSSAIPPHDGKADITTGIWGIWIPSFPQCVTGSCCSSD